ncbi:hypothetical protein PIB30_002219 [Stylosanthes scabra]|uniref:Uncharacterized protein n=1 Tax=Stylosanthes scabra TaxID=79078 RepID=A0ABU6T2I6_9FABA|nr:hypothetical protein [Stylosanthes scabra]
MQNHIHSSSSSSCTAFSAIHVRHSEPVLVVPAKPIPKETKHVSDIDDQEGLRIHNYDIMFYKSNPRMKAKDPAKVIMEAISMALVHYYPLAGDSIRPPCLSIWKQVLIHVPGSDIIIGCPLLLIQFLEMVATIARDPQALLIHLPVWQRHIFTARDPPRVTCNHPEYEDDTTNHNNEDQNHNDMAHESFFFGPKQIMALRKHLPSNLSKCSTLELLAACLWKCRTIALDMNPNEVVSVSCFITAHGKIGIPKGYYGNAFAFPAAVSEAGTLCRKPLSYGVELIREAKAKMKEEYIRSMVDFLVMKGRPMYRSSTGHLMVGDLTRVGFDEVDFGWGKAVYGGSMGARPLVSFLCNFRNGRGEDGIVAPILLPRLVMKRFLLELLKITGDYQENKFHHHRLNDKMETDGRRSKL